MHNLYFSFFGPNVVYLLYSVTYVSVCIVPGRIQRCSLFRISVLVENQMGLEEAGEKVPTVLF